MYQGDFLNERANPNNASAAENICHQLAVYARYCNEELQAVIDCDVKMIATNKINITAHLIQQEFGSIGHSIRDEYLQEADCKEILLKLIDNGANVNATNLRHQSAIMVACLKGNVNVINTFLDARGDPTTADADGETCLHYAVHGGCNQERIAIYANRVTCCLHCTVHIGCNKETLYTIIDHCADINAINKHNETALVSACNRNNTDAVNVLLTSKAEPNIADIWGNTLLHNAVHQNINKETIQAIIDHGADVNSVNTDGATAVLLACKAGQKETVRLLLTAGADTSIVNNGGDTCLHKLFHRVCDQETLQMLLDHGVNVNAKNKNNKTAYMLAYEQGNTDAQYALVRVGADPGITLDDSDSSLHPGYIDAQCAFVHTGADPDITLDGVRGNDSDSDSESSIFNRYDLCSSCHRTLCCVIA